MQICRHKCPSVNFACLVSAPPYQMAKPICQKSHLTG
uniref:Uncharacterized protein n=1 Tax=Arundo donax TaxID=35708 RepID=A0A0A9T8K4_ARUDO